MQAGPVDPGVLGARLRQQTQIDDPITGATDPLDVEARSTLWPHASQWALIELIGVSESGARRLEEFRFIPASGVRGLPPLHGAGLPVAMVFERSPNGASRARLYSARALVAARAPVVPVDVHLRAERDAEDVLARYFPALQSAQLPATLDSFEQDGYLQCSNGEVYRGRERLRARFVRAYQNGGITLGYCTRIDDGARTVLETCGADSRPAVAVYERGGAGKLAAVRLYR